MPNKFVDTIQNIDCVDGLSNLPDKCIDIIITDPPYGLNKVGIPNDNNLNLFYKVLPECFRVLKQDAYFVTFFSTKFLPEVFKNNPFVYFWNFILYCPNASVSSPVGYTKYMSCVVFKKGEPKMNRKNKDIFVDTPGKMIEPDEGYINHPTPKPKTFIKELISLFSKEGDIVLDPFIGSGSVAVASKQLRRRYIGFEIDENYCKIARDRLNRF